MRTERRRLRMCGLIPAALLALTLSACEEDLVVISGTELPYSVYGLFTPDIDTQWVRVFPIEGTLEPREPVPLGAVVTSRDLETGEVRVWRDSVVQDFRGLYEHAYWSHFRAEHGHRYRLEVQRPQDLSTAHAQIQVPVAVEFEQGVPSRTPPISFPVHIRGNVPRVSRAEVSYDVQYDPNPTRRDIFRLPYNDKLARTDDGFVVQLNLTDDFRVLRDSLRQDNRYNSFGIAIVNVSVSVLIATDEWYPPSGVWDAEVIGIPGQMNNVENGFGFVAAGYRRRHTLTVADSVAVAAGFRPVPVAGS